ncbi:MAG: adenosylmethionine decarboxylase [Bacillota bacterium]
MKTFDTMGAHILADFWGCSYEKLDDAVFVMDSLRQAARAANMTVLDEKMHKFHPQGLTALLLLAESHISIHTYPEKGYAAIDVFTCGSGMTAHAVEYLREALGPTEFREINVTRGIPENKEENEYITVKAS